MAPRSARQGFVLANLKVAFADGDDGPAAAIVQGAYSPRRDGLARTRISAGAGRPASSRQTSIALFLARMIATAAQSLRSPGAFDVAVRFFNLRSMKPVSIVLASTSGCVTYTDREAICEGIAKVGVHLDSYPGAAACTNRS